MCLRMHPDLDMRPDPKRMVEWLLEKIGVVNGTKRLDGPVTALQSSIIQTAPGRGRLSKVKKRSGEKPTGTSWRAIKVHSEEGSPVFEMRLKSESWVLPSFKRTMTLGEIHDGLQKVLSAIGSMDDYFSQCDYQEVYSQNDENWDGEPVDCDFEGAAWSLKDDCTQEDLWLPMEDKGSEE